jgi:signal peptidase I
MKEMKPIPGFRIIPWSIIVSLAVLYVYDSLKEHLGRAETKDAEPMTKEEKKRRMNGLIRDLAVLFSAIILGIVLHTQVINITVIQSASMEPTLMTGNTVFVNRLAYKTGKTPERGDIVIFWSDEHNEYLGKRVIGLPGDEIAFSDGHVVVNGAYLDETAYLSDETETICAKTFLVPEGCYFMLGDNRSYSYDSRFWQNPYISQEDIIGKYMGQIAFSFQAIYNRLRYGQDFSSYI